MALDLGSIFGQALSSVVDYQINRFMPPQQVLYDNPLIPNIIETNLPSTSTGMAGMDCGNTGPKRVLGYLSPDGTFCKKKSRRRRNRLATTSDIKDLASLKAVLGGGKAFETWIATH